MHLFVSLLYALYSIPVLFKNSVNWLYLSATGPLCSCAIGTSNVFSGFTGVGVGCGVTDVAHSGLNNGASPIGGTTGASGVAGANSGCKVVSTTGGCPISGTTGGIISAVGGTILP